MRRKRKRAVASRWRAQAERETRLRLQGEVKRLCSVVDKLVGRPSITIHNQGGVMGDTYKNSGQAGAIGRHAQAHELTFNQVSNPVLESIDLLALAKELYELRQAMAEKPSPPVATATAAMAMGRLAEAEIAAAEKNAPRVIEHLRVAGQWALEFAKELGKSVVVAAIRRSLGMP